MMLLSLLVKSFSYYPEGNIVLKDFTFEIDRSEIVALMGENGCGKSTILNLCAGEINGNGITRSGDISDKETAFVYQDYRRSLFPWKTALSNICLPAKIRGKLKEKINNMVSELTDSFEVDFDLNTFPGQLSGGELQKVSVLRALMEAPELLLLDEPCSAMDYASRLIFLKQLRSKLKNSKTAVILVSHSAEEALLFSDKVVLLSEKGEIAHVLEKCYNKNNYMKYMDQIHAHFLV